MKEYLYTGNIKKFREDYNSGRFGHLDCAIARINGSFRLFNETQHKEQMVADHLLDLYHTNRKRFTGLFGKHHFVFDGEVRTYNWVFEYKGRMFVVYTDADSSYRGTTYEMILSLDEQQNVAWQTNNYMNLYEEAEQFMQEFVKFLKEVEKS